MSSKTEKAQIDLIINGATANQSIRDLEAAARKAKSELRGLAPDSAKFKELSANLANINKELDKTKVQAGLAKSSWDKMKESIKTTFVGNLGANLATLGFEKIAGYVTDAFGAAVKLSDQMADLRKTTGMTAEEARKLRTELSQIDTRTSMSDLLEIAKVGGQFGIAKDQIYGFVKAVDMTTVALGDEFTGGAEQVATEMSKLRNIFKDIQTDDIGTDVNFISNAINVLAASGVATGPVVSDLANRIGGVGVQLGLTSGQVLGLSATLQELGVNSERGGTAVVKILQKMLTNTDEFAKIAGMNVGSFKDLLNKDLYGAFVKVMEGSKQLGPNAGLLAGIIKDLEVQGAGASEVFAKLGSNTDMLAQKTTLASDALTNTTSITEEFRLKNDNLAGSVEQLSKEWNKLTSNPAMVNFFKVGVDLTREMIGGVKELANWTARLWGGKAEAAAQAAMRQFEQDKENQEREKQIYANNLASYKQHLAQMSNADLDRELAKLAIQQQAHIAYMKELMANGDKEQFYIELRWGKQLAAEANAVRKVQQQRLDANKKGNEELSKEEIKAMEKREREAKKTADKLLKIELDRMRDTFKAMEADNERMKQYGLKVGKDVMAYIQEGKTAAAQLKILTATSAADEIQGIKDLYAVKLAEHQQGTAQYKLLHAQMLQEIADAEKKYADESVKTEKDKNKARLDSMQSAANTLLGVISLLNSRQSQLSQNRLTAQRKEDQRERDDLKRQLDSKIITQETYERKLMEIDAAANERERKQRKEDAEAEKGFALFSATIKAALAWIEAYLTGDFSRAVLATAEVGVIAATPVPEFYTGGWMPNSSNDKEAFPIIAHANEYMVDAKSARDPYVIDTIGIIETAKKRGVSPSSIASETAATGTSTPQTVVIQSDPELKQLLIDLKVVLQDGVEAHIIPSEDALRTWEKETQKRLGSFRSRDGKPVADNANLLFANKYL